MKAKSKNGKAKATVKKSNAGEKKETFHNLRTNALRALGCDPFNRDALRAAAGKAPAKSRSNVIALAKKVQPKHTGDSKKAA
jgi:hypothetical protein